MKFRKETIIEFKNGLKFFYIQGLFTIEQFLEQPYHLAEVEGRDVVDIGAFNGDSAIFFAWKGAKRVYAFEPIPMSFKIAKANINLNRFENVEMFNEAIGLSEGKLTISEDMAGSISFSITEFVNQPTEGKLIRIRAFSDFVIDYEIQDAVLKMDCEGCEYDILLNVEEAILLCFHQIILEYHKGPDRLVQRLNKLGYTTKILDQSGRFLQKNTTNSGLIYARK